MSVKPTVLILMGRVYVVTQLFLTLLVTVSLIVTDAEVITAMLCIGLIVTVKQCKM